METVSVAINDSFDVLCFGLYLINIFAKSTKAEGAQTLGSSWHFIVYLLLLKIQIYNNDKDMKI